MKKFKKEEFVQCIQNMEECIPELPSIIIMKRAGNFDRLSGTLFKSWKKSFVALSHDNYLHVYNSEQDIEPQTSIKLVAATVNGYF